MRDRVHYYSKRDMSSSFYWERAAHVIYSFQNGSRPADVNDLVEFYNIWLFVENGVHDKTWSDEMLATVSDFKEYIIAAFSALVEVSWLATYKQLDKEYRPFFWEIVDRFNVACKITEETLEQAVSGVQYELVYVLQRKRLVKKYDGILARLLKKNENTAEWLLSEFVQQKDNSRSSFSFPSSLSLSDRESIISEYLDRLEPNLNYVGLVLEAKRDANLSLSDDVVYKAKVKARELNDKHFKDNTGFPLGCSVVVSGETDKPTWWIEYDKDSLPVYCYSKQVMLQCKSSEILHYCRSVFGFMTANGMVDLISKQSQSTSFERVFGLRGKNSYPRSLIFDHDEKLSFLQMYALDELLRGDGDSIEASVKDFYERHLKERYGYPSSVMTLLDTPGNWIAKCRILAPEIDAIAKRYDQYAKYGAINEELIEISSDTVRITEARSCIQDRYYTIKGEPDDLYRLFYLFFSDQCMLTYVEPFKGKGYHTFYQLLIAQEGNIQYENYHEYQLRELDYLIKEGYLAVYDARYIIVKKKAEITLLKHLYDFNCCPAFAYNGAALVLLDEMKEKGWLETDGHLLSVLERNYFDYYMYNTRYTNGPALRNRYSHGSNSCSASEQTQRKAYYRLLILLILELLKIEEDLAYQAALLKAQRHRDGNS